MSQFPDHSNGLPGMVGFNIFTLNANRVGTDAGHNAVCRFTGGLIRWAGGQILNANDVATETSSDANGTEIKIGIPGLWKVTALMWAVGANAIQAMLTIDAQLSAALLTQAGQALLPSGNLQTGAMVRGGSFATSVLNAEVPFRCEAVFPITRERAETATLGVLRLSGATTVLGALAAANSQAGAQIIGEYLGNPFGY